jgi:hypothetical protein
MEFAPDGRLFVAEKHGELRAIDENGNLLPEPFVDIQNQVDQRGERGLRSVAFDPQFGDTVHDHVYYTQKASS